jgi:hypothetical protein
MELPILIEPTPEGRFRARVGDPFHVTAEGEAAAQAVQHLVEAVRKRLDAGARIAVLTVTNGTVQAAAPPLPADDAYKTDWVYRELQAAIAENRRQEEAAGP